MAGADVPSGEDNSPADADAAETANAATVHRIVRARNMAYLRVLDDLAARDTNGAEIFRAGRVAVRLGCHHRDMAMSVIDVRLDPPLLDALRRRADAEGVSVNELVRRLVRDGLSREHEARAVGPSAPAAEPAGDDASFRRSA